MDQNTSIKDIQAKNCLKLLQNEGFTKPTPEILAAEIAPLLYDFSHTPPRLSRENLARAIQLLVDEGVLTINEIDQETGYPIKP